MPADLAPHLRGETSARRSAQALCPQPCRPHPCRRRRVFRQCGSARWFGRSSGDVWLSVRFILRMRHSRVNERRPWRGCFASLPDGRQPLAYGLWKGCPSTAQNQTTSIVIHYFRPTTANFHEPSLCRFSTRTPLPSVLTGLSFAEIL